MKAVIFPDAEAITVERVADPGCGPDEVIVQMGMCGICGTDLHIYRNEYMSKFPLIPGHEFGGRIVEVGREVKMGFAVGDLKNIDDYNRAKELFQANLAQLIVRGLVAWQRLLTTWLIVCIP